MPDIASVHLDGLMKAQTLQQMPENNVSDPATLYKDGQRPAKVHRVDMEPWLALGWSLTPVAKSAPVAEPAIVVAEEPAPVPVVVEAPVVVPARRKRGTDTSI
jgi:hypothetical protein